MTFFGGAPEKYAKVAWWQFIAVINWFEKLGIPTKASKCLSPMTRIKIRYRFANGIYYEK